VLPRMPLPEKMPAATAKDRKRYDQHVQ
jgi:hypothetical protein